MEENKKIFQLIYLSVNGDMKATFELILKFEPLINKYSKVNGKFDQESKDYIIDQLIKNIKEFKKIKKIFNDC